MNLGMGAARGKSLSAWGYLSFFVWALGMVAVLPPTRVPWLLALTVVLGLAIAGAQIGRTLANWRLWLILLLVVVLSAFIVGEADVNWRGIRLSSEGFWAGLGMAMRALCITLGFAASIGALSVSEMSRLFERLGLKGLGFALGVALNMMHALREVVNVTYHTCRLRGGFRRNILSGGQRFLIGTITNALRYGDDVVLAASARAFDPARTSGPKLSLTQADGIFLLLLAGLSVVLSIS